MFSLNPMFGTILVAFAVVIIQCQLANGQLIDPPVLVDHPAVVIQPDDDHHFHDVHAPRPAAAFAYLRQFLAGQHQQQTLELMEREHQHHVQQEQAYRLNGICNINEKFAGCCNQIGMSSVITDIPQLIKNGCRYPPNELTTKQKITLGYYFNEYVMCYADGQDHRQCCADAGVPSSVTYFFWTVNCQDLCRGERPKLTANAAWDKCSIYKPQIAACNMKNVDLESQSAAEKYGFCQNSQWCKGKGWKAAC